MSPRQALLDQLERLDARDPDHLPVVPLAAYFEGNDFEECIAVRTLRRHCCKA